MAVRGLSPVVVSRGYSTAVAHGLLIVVASLLADHGLWSVGSVAVVHGFSCPLACGIFLDQGLNPCIVHHVSPALSCEFLTTGPPGKSQEFQSVM